MIPYRLTIQKERCEYQSPLVMGIINVTPDSFSDSHHLLPAGGLAAIEETALAESILVKASKHINEGADILDIGGYSTRPGAPEVTAEEEKKRVCFAIRTIRKEWPTAVLSVDTFRASVAQAAISCGADIVNDISGGQLDTEMFPMMGALGVPYILTHMRGTPATMQQMTDYNDIMEDIIGFFREKVCKLENLGIKDIIIDPGFGFAKTTEQNYLLLRRMRELETLGRPILAGVSRKSMIYNPLKTTPQDALNGTTAINMVALMNGAAILRVHDVKEAKETIRLYNMLSIEEGC